MIEVQLFGPAQISTAPTATMTDIGGVGSALTQGPAGRGGAAQRESTFAPNSLQLQSPGNLRLQPGMTMRGQVMQNDGGNVLLRFGQTTLEATTELPLQQGQHVDVQVSGQQQGKWSLQMTGSQLFTPMAEDDVSTALMQHNLPATETNVEVAKTMISMGLPLRGEDLKELVKNLAQLPRTATPQDMMAAVFLKAASLPMTQSNLQTLAHFITEHPFIGLQLMSVQGAFRKLLKDDGSRGTMSASLIELLEEAPGLLGEMALDPLQTSGRKMQQQLHNMAFQAGIESMGPHVGDDFDMQEWLKSLRERLFEESAPSALLASAAALLADLEQNLAAVRLMNSAATAEQGSFYFQIPMKPTDETAEARLIYHVDSQGRPLIDDDNAVIELRIPTENLGVVSWQIVICDGSVAIDAAVDTEDGRTALAAHLPALMARLQALGYQVASPTCRPRAKTEQASMPRIQAPEFESLERVDIQA